MAKILIKLINIVMTIYKRKNIQKIENIYITKLFSNHYIVGIISLHIMGP